MAVARWIRVRTPHLCPFLIFNVLV